ncbi:MAG: hypothetical protein ABIL58_23325 [Pseudomonadota bacterium]
MERYRNFMKGVDNRASQMLAAIYDPVRGDDGGIIGDPKARHERLEAVTQHTVFESAGKGAATIQTLASNALAAYVRRYGCLPSPGLLASAHMAIEQGIIATSPNAAKLAGMPGVFESAGSTLATTEGILMRDRMIALVLPVMLQSITGRMVTHIPGQFNQSEIFRIRKVAGSTFGDLTKGDVIDVDFNGHYAAMDQRFLAAIGDGTEVGGAASSTPNFFRLDSATDIGVKMPFRRKRCVVYHDRTPVANDKEGDGNLYGTFVLGGSTITVTGTVDYANGVVNPVFSVAPANLIEIHIGVDIDIEADPSLIPIIDYLEDSKVLYPHESALNCGYSLQALWAMRREYNIEMEGMAMTDMRNLIAADKDRKILNDIRFFLLGDTEWTMDVTDGLYFQEHYETLKQTLLAIDATILARTGRAGLVGLVLDSKSASLVKSMRQPNFEPAPGYKRIPQPHYIGRLFGMWDAYEDPNAPTDYESICFGIGNTVGEAGYVTGDCIPPLPFKHPVLSNLHHEQTLWSMGYRDLHPFDGRNYFHKLSFVNE